MTSHWDSSAVINAAISVQVLARLDTGEHIGRLHTLAEFFSTMTGRGVQSWIRRGSQRGCFLIHRSAPLG